MDENSIKGPGENVFGRTSMRVTSPEQSLLRRKLFAISGLDQGLVDRAIRAVAKPVPYRYGFLWLRKGTQMRALLEDVVTYIINHRAQNWKQVFLKNC